MDPKTFAAIAAMKVCLVRTVYCLPLTYAQATLGCQHITRWGCRQRTACPAISIDWQFDPQIYKDQLTELRNDLRTALAELQKHEKETAEDLKNASRLYLEELETGLKDALDEIKKVMRERE
jgi:hypothetical protein